MRKRTPGDGKADASLNAEEMLIRGLLPLYVLETLRRGPRHGLGIIQTVRAETDCTWSPSPGTMYPLLRRLEQDGFILGAWEDGTRRPRRYYRLTAEGELEAQRLRAALEPRLRRTLRLLQVHLERFFPRNDEEACQPTIGQSPGIVEDASL